MSDVTIPETWRVITGHLVRAEAAQVLMRDASLPRPMRDQATAGYVRAADALVAELAVLRKSGVMAAIAEHLWAQHGA